MERASAASWPKGIGLALAALLLLSLLTFDLNDPTLTNLRLPAGGVRNLLGLPGALLGGSLIELFGTAALLVPALVFNWSLTPRRRPRWWRYLGHGLVALAALATLYGLAAPRFEPGLLSAGLVGWAGVRWVRLSTGPWLGAALCAFVAGYAASRLLYAPQVAAVGRDVRTFAGYFARKGRRAAAFAWGRARAAARQTGRSATGLATGAGHLAGDGLGALAGLALAPPRAVAGAVAGWRAPSVGRVKARRAYGDPAGRFAAPATAEVPDASVRGGAEQFDAWFAPLEARPGSAPAQPAATAEPPENPASPEPAGPAPEATERAVSSRPSQPPAAATEPEPRPEARPEAKPDDATAPQAPDAGGETDYTFGNPRAEEAWRAQFQRYARNADLDWQTEPWRRRRREEEPEGPGEATPPKRG